ncbi:MAG: adenylosuccinate lyase [Deltaproteobacteria bacterium]|nr:adenylosuccinate lyase [Deltaproteobacteria bacterium]MBW2134019.1 adenylosuccinate lyase [Deltaproteobacteria bacterium]
MIPRYSREPMARIWTEEYKYHTWLQVELAALEAMAELGLIPQAAASQIKAKAAFDPQRIEAIEAQTRHDVIAFLTNVAEYVGEDSRYLHYGLTSSDILDTAMALRLREAAELLLADLDELLSVLHQRALEFKDTVMIGRSHGVHAEPITFGLKLALWYAEMQRHRQRLERAREAINVGKLSGAVGTFAHLPPQVEEMVCERLGLRPAPVSTQVIQRDRYAEYFTTLALIGGGIEKIAVEIRHLQRTEVREAEEFFAKGQKGSSAMPHKRNPILCENLSGLARILRANALAALENMALWHERDISHSSVERIIAPDSAILLDFMLHRLTGLLRNLLVYPEAMRHNLERTQGLIFSQGLLLELIRRGATREQAYLLVQGPAMRVWEEGCDFYKLVSTDPAIRQYLSEAEIAAIFDLRHYLQHIDRVYERVFANRKQQGR